MAKVYFVREEISIEVPVGISVLEAEIRAGLAPDAPCGGQGTCGKCLVKVDGKPVLACQTKVEKDCRNRRYFKVFIHTPTTFCFRYFGS